MSKWFILIILTLLAGTTLATLKLKTHRSNEITNAQLQKIDAIRWEYDLAGKNWRAFGSPPECQKPFVFPSPVDVSLVSGILYPGQERSGDYKPHGGFRFDGLNNNEVDVFAPFDGNAFQAARHTTQSGEIQYVLYVLNNCGIVYKLDHLLEVTEKFQKIMDAVPLAGINDTRTTGISPPVFVAKGEHVATKVGLSGNVFFDFGVYDLRQKNEVDYSDRDYYNISQYGEYALCWLENLEEPDKSIVKNLPGVDGQSGKKSDYCN